MACACSFEWECDIETPEAINLPYPARRCDLKPGKHSKLSRTRRHYICESTYLVGRLDIRVSESLDLLLSKVGL